MKSASDCLELASDEIVLAAARLERLPESTVASRIVGTRRGLPPKGRTGRVSPPQGRGELGGRRPARHVGFVLACADPPVRRGMPSAPPFLCSFGRCPCRLASLADARDEPRPLFRAQFVAELSVPGRDDHHSHHQGVECDQDAKPEGEIHPHAADHAKSCGQHRRPTQPLRLVSVPPRSHSSSSSVPTAPSTERLRLMAPREAIASAKVSRAAGRGSHRSVHFFLWQPCYKVASRTSTWPTRE